MAGLTSAISVQVNTQDKKKATKILDQLGVTMSGLINMTIKQVIMKGGIPFDVTVSKEDDLTEYFTEEELEESAKELEYIENHLDEYRENNKWDDLRKEIL